MRSLIGKSLMLSLVLIISCKTDSSSGDIRSVSINPDSSRSVLFSDLFEYINYLPLEGNLTGQIKKIIFDNDSIYIASNFPACITTYSSKGQQSYLFCNQGEAPGQYSNIKDFGINRSENEIEILDRNNLMLLSYEFSGDFIGGVRHFMFANAFQRLDNERVAIYCGNEITQLNNTKIVIYNERNKKVENGFLDIPKEIEQRYANFQERNNFAICNDSLLFFHSLNDTIYYLTKNELIPRTHISFGDYSIPKSFLERGYANVQVFMEQVRKTDYAFKITGYQETEDFITFIFEHKGKFKLAYYDKKSGKQKVANELQDDLLINGLNLDNIIENGPYATTERGEVVFIVEAPILKEAVSKYKNSMSAEEWEKLTSSNEQLQNITMYLTKSDNPVLLLAKYKGL